MSLAAALAAETGRKRAHSRCTVDILLDVMCDDDRNALMRAFASDATSASIARALRSENHDIAQQTLARHRKGECACEPR